jgi:hypothetical protein
MIECPARFADDQFPWRHIDLDDFICRIGHYVLRVQAMGPGHWWWRVSYKDEAIPTILNEFTSSKDRAIGLCEGVYLGHSQTINK